MQISAPILGQLIQEVAVLNEKIAVEIYDFVADAKKPKNTALIRFPR